MHLDLWPAPMRAGFVVARGYLFAVASPLHRNSEGGRGQQRPCHFVKATSRGTKARWGSERRRRDVDGNYGAIREALLT